MSKQLTVIQPHESESYKAMTIDGRRYVVVELLPEPLTVQPPPIIIQHHHAIHPWQQAQAFENPKASSHFQKPELDIAKHACLLVIFLSFLAFLAALIR